MSNDVAKACGSLPAKRPGPNYESDEAGAEMIFTSQRPHALSRALMPFFGGRVPA